MAVRFSNAAYGPVQLRELLRARMEGGERLIGFAVAQLNPSPTRVLSQVALAMLPGIGQAAAVLLSLSSQRHHRVVVLTSRRVLLLRADRTGPEPSGRGVAAELPLALLSVGCSPEVDRSARLAPPRPARGRLRRARRRRATLAELAAQVSVFSLVDAESDGKVDLVLPRTNHGATGRLREALFLLAENPREGSPYNPGRDGARSSTMEGPAAGVAGGALS